MRDFTRFIETEGFPLDAASEASSTESSANKGSIRRLHRYPARRPLAACRAAILATLLPDPGSKEDRINLSKLIGELLQRNTGETKELLRARELLKHGRDEEWKVLDPFAGGGSIPFEALRLGCKIESSDLNPVSWFVQMATMYYPSKIGLNEIALPETITDDIDCLKAAGGAIKGSTIDSYNGSEKKNFNLSEHVAAWGTWLIKQSEEVLRPLYHSTEGAKPIAYLWCRTYNCPECGGSVPIFNNSILQRRGNKVVAAVEPIVDKINKSIEWNVLCSNSGHDLIGHEKISFKSRNKVTCPYCDCISITSKEIRRDAQENGLGHELIAVLEQHVGSRKYRPPSIDDLQCFNHVAQRSKIAEYNKEDGPFNQPIPKSGKGASRAFTVGSYGMNKWYDLFNERQYYAIHVLMNQVQKANALMRELDYPEDWSEAITVYLNCVINLSTERNTVISRWNPGGGKVESIYDTYSLPIRWLYAEILSTSSGTGSIQNALRSVTQVIQSIISSTQFSELPSIKRRSALTSPGEKFELIITDPPYYDQIPYSDTLDFFHMIIREVCGDLNTEFATVFRQELTPKWDSESDERELIDDANRHDKNSEASKKAYEDGMSDVFGNLYESLEDNGRLVVVFAHKNPEAWETLVSALIRAGFQTTAAWPIRTESANKVHSGMRAFLSTSVWLVLKKRDPMADYVFDRDVYPSIKDNIEEKLRRFWDAGIRGPDFLWAALGPGLEIFSQYEVVRKFESSDGDELVSVGEFLNKVRDVVLRFSIGRLLSDYGSGDEEAEQIDNLTRYYLLHRNWFGHLDVGAGEVTKFAVACGFTDSQLAGRSDILSSLRGTKRRLSVAAETTAADAQADADKRGGSKYRLNRWNERGPPQDNNYFQNEERPPALIDHVHRLLYLRMEGDKQSMDNHIKHWALGGHPVMPALVQALQEICKEENGKSIEELSLLESLSKDLDRLAGVKPAKEPTLMDWMNKEED
jgi:putative DNA methylase